VDQWRGKFSNCYLGFTGVAVEKFSRDQIDALNAVLDDRLLLETDSPHLPVNFTTTVNTQVWIG
jgi:Tat protein secretion system quality control protein TatD with DNase activity